MCCSVVCLCTREQRRSPPVRTLAICNESIKATVATVWVSTVCRTGGGQLEITVRLALFWPASPSFRRLSDVAVE
jgi:hypothetical protein